ncbi:hypothetical protein K435DRAFT_872606 [Dendrothele bispora CBS 962.96]|uniref:Chromatin elongation factor spt5 n=1 Tax=Dendrothele bispora (strain CBS 962.96) TaxID=1314807 RepID=A0A4S8L1L0_DENBC|nr:hypothetical protein K435DRAFT_872606 [Dendrothele bispora CBS 962.96]
MSASVPHLHPLQHPNPSPRVLMWVLDNQDLPRNVRPRTRLYAAKYHILIELYPQLETLLQCPATKRPHSVRITYYGSLHIKCKNCNVGEVKTFLNTVQHSEFCTHYKRWRNWQREEARWRRLTEDVRAFAVEMENDLAELDETNARLNILCDEARRIAQEHTVVMPNPFIDDQAYEDDQELPENDPNLQDSGDELHGGGDLGAEEGWIDEDDVPQDLQYNSIDPPQPLSRTEHRVDIYQERIQDLEQRYIPNTIQTGPPTNAPLPAHNNDSGGSVLPTTCNMNDRQLNLTLLTSDKQQFWRIKCKAGREMELVFAIMESGLLTASPSTTPSTSIPSHFSHTEPSPSIQSVAPSARALRIIRRYAITQVGEPKDITDEIERLLGSDFSSDWNRLVDAAGLEPGVEDPVAAAQTALEAVNAKAAQFLPVSILTEADDDSGATGTITNTLLPTLGTHLSAPQSTCSLGHSTSSTLLSVFTVPTIQGYVYLEGRWDEHGRDWLRHHTAVIKTKATEVFMEPVPSEDIPVLLDTPMPTIQSHSWVQVTRGPYRGDVGFVLSKQMLGGQRRFVLLLVPRLPSRNCERPPTPPPKETHPLLAQQQPNLQPSRSSVASENSETTQKKRKRGPEQHPQRLFHEVNFRGECEQVAPNVFRWKNNEYRYGLIVKYYDSSSLNQADVVMDRNTRRLFGLTQEPSIMKATFPMVDDWVFFVQEKVVVVMSSPLNEQQKLNPSLPRSTYMKDGVIMDTGKQDSLVQFNDFAEWDSDDTAIRVSNINLRKKINVGDSVVVEAGEMHGREGLVTWSWLNTLEVLESKEGVLKTFNVEINSCRVTALRNGDAVPWLDKHVTVIFGQYTGYSGIIVDTHPPKPQYTMLDVKIPSLGITVHLKHDHVVDTISKQYLRFATPLKDIHQHFAQLDWDAYRSPNLRYPPVDPFTGHWLTAEDIVTRQPEQPWLNVPVVVVSGHRKGFGNVKNVERSHLNKSRLRVLVEYSYMSADHGTVPQFWTDYGAVRDPKTGLPLHIVYPLRGHQRYWEPMTRLKAVSVPNPYLLNHWGRQESGSGSATPPYSPGPLVDPFAGPSSCRHWAVDPRLDGKTFYARWQPQSGDALAKIRATPVTRSGKVQIKEASGMGGILVPPEEIYDVQVPIKPTTNRLPLLVVRGEHTGKFLRQIWCTYHNKNDEQPLIAAAVFDNWGTTAEALADPYHVEVRAEDCAEAADDINKNVFKQKMKELRDEARRPKPGCTTKKKVYKPRK